MENIPFNAIIIRNHIRDLRKDFALTQEELAEAVGVSRQSIISVESGKCLPSIPLAVAISRIFKSPIEQLFEFENNQVEHEVFMNIYQTENTIVVEADVPGMREEDLDIEIADGVLTIKGERQETNNQTGKEYVHREVSFGFFQRAITLPADVYADRASAEVKNGQLIVTIPKTGEVLPKVHKVSLKKS